MRCRVYTREGHRQNIHVVDVFGADGACVIADDSYFPVTLIKIAGIPTVGLIREFFAWNDIRLDRGVQENTGVVHVLDLLEGRVPQSNVRSLIASLHAAQRERYGVVSLAAHVALSSQLVLGTITVINWIASNKIELRPVSTLAEAIEGALGTLGDAGLEAPEGLKPHEYAFRIEPGERGRETPPPRAVGKF